MISSIPVMAGLSGQQEPGWSLEKTQSPCPRNLRAVCIFFSSGTKMVQSAAYSYLNESAGFFKAAVMACTLMVARDIRRATTKDSRNGIIPRSMR